MVVLFCFINPFDTVKIQDVEKETKKPMCVCVGGGGGGGGVQGQKFKNQKITKNKKL
jgi:hypothetical protein